jgi:DNA-directed RNA polymerase specialized sigma24 family protein
MSNHKGVLDRPSRANWQTNNTNEHTAASTGTSELVARASSGDQVAWDQLVERHGGLVWAVARAHGLAHADASEVSQVTWLLLTQHLGILQQAERLESWLLRTASREAYRMARLRGCEVPRRRARPGAPPRPPGIAEVAVARTIEPAHELMRDRGIPPAAANSYASSAEVTRAVRTSGGGRRHTALTDGCDQDRSGCRRSQPDLPPASCDRYGFSLSSGRCGRVIR